MTENILVVVDGYSSGAQLPTVMREHGWQCVHVSSSPNPPEYYLTTYRPGDYVDNLAYEGHVDGLVRELGRYRPSAVLPGTESGVIIADLVADALGLPGNDPATSAGRRDKYEMHNRLKANGLRAMDHYLARDVDGLLAWARAGSWPVVLKPQASAGTDSVMFCADPAELERGFRALHGTVNHLGGCNEAVLAQRFLTGQEYFINGVSGNSRHVITEIWRTDKIRVPGAGMIYDRSTLLDPTDAETKPIVQYVHQVLDVLGSRHGANHTELMVDDEGPTLIECASRLSGGLNRAAANHAVGASMLDLAGRLAVEGGAMVERLAESQQPLLKPLWQVQFISNQSGVVVESFYDDMVKALRSKAWLQRAPKPGDRVERTTNLFNSPGIVFMSHSDPEVLQADYETVRAWERENRLFTVEEDAPA